MKRIFSLCLLAFSVPALAHVSLMEPTASAGSYYRMTLKIGHGCGTSPTHTVTVTLPDGIYSAKPMPKDGWKLSTTSAVLAKPYTSHGKTITEDVHTITWAGGHLPNEFYDEFVVSVKLGDEPGKRAIPITQLCDEGRLDWVEVAKEGEPEPKSPAPILEVTPAVQQHEHGAHMSAAPAATGSDGEQIAQIMKATWDKPEAPLQVEILQIDGDVAVAGWSQAGKGGRALLRKHAGQWVVVACTGPKMKQADFLQELGIEPNQAQALIAKMTEAEAKLPADLPKQYDSFEGVVLMNGKEHVH